MFSMLLQAWAPVGMHKYHSFMEYVQLYPEYDFIFLGDNGQGDAMCADRVIEKAGESPPYLPLSPPLPNIHTGLDP